MLILRLVGAVFILMSVWQFWQADKYCKVLQTKVTKDNFSPLALYSGTVLGVFALGLGLWFLIDPLSIQSMTMNMK